MKQLNSLLLLLILCCSTPLLAISGHDGGPGGFMQSFNEAVELLASVDNGVDSRASKDDNLPEKPRAKGSKLTTPARIAGLCEDVEPETMVTLETCLGANDGEVVISPNGGDPGRYAVQH